MNAVETALVWLLATVLAVAVGVAVAGSSDSEFSSLADAMAASRAVSLASRGTTTSRPRVHPWLSTNRNPANSIPNGGPASAWTM